MLTACKDELPNPHKSCLREILDALVCHDHDVRRINVELRDLQTEFKREIEKIECQCNELRKKICPVESTDKIFNFTRHVATIDEVNSWFTEKIEKLKKNRDEILDAAKKCLFQLNSEKCKFKRFHEKTVDYLKRYAVKSDDPLVIRNCEKDICEMHKLFVREVAVIKRCETELMPFLKQLQDRSSEYVCSCCCFENYDWMPKGKSLQAVQETSNNIKSTMGKTMAKAFAQLHIHQPPDPRSFLSAYLMNLERSEKAAKEKLNLIGTT